LASNDIAKYHVQLVYNSGPNIINLGFRDVIGCGDWQLVCLM